MPNTEAEIEGSLGFLGAGQMARALSRGMLAAGLIRAERIVAYDPVPDAGQALEREVPGARCVESNEAVCRQAQTIILAVKPQSVPAVAASLKTPLGPDKLLVSIVAGLPLETLAGLFHTRRAIRVMPNTPCLVGQGAAAYALGQQAEQADGQRVQRMLSAVGTAVAVDEALLDAVTGLSGSGPAFVYLAIEALSDGGVRMGLPRAVAIQLAAQTVAGAARMVLDSGQHPAQLKDHVASPGGTTMAGLQALEDRGARAAFMAAVQAATHRSQELGRVQEAGPGQGPANSSPR